MGGSLFTSGSDPLYTPRMPTEVYKAVRDHCHAILFSLFVVVASPIEGPGKTTFGDIDILVALPHDNSLENVGAHGVRILHEAINRLGAVRSSLSKGKGSLAIQWPVDLLPLAPAPQEPGDIGKVPHIQVDLSLLPSLDLLYWALFKHAHGDFWNIVGSSILRPLGLVVDEQALWIRVPEIENKDRKRARVFLSDEPAEVLHFLGIQVSISDDDDNSNNGQEQEQGTPWDRPFPSAQALFDSVTNSRFFYLADLRNEAHNIAANTDPSLGQHADLKSNDRRRLKKRPLFSQWAAYMQTLYGTYEHLPTKMYSDAVPTRESVRTAAFAKFPGSEERYEVIRTSYLQETHLVAIRSAAKAAVPPFLRLCHRGGVIGAIRRALGVDKDGATATEAAQKWTVDSVFKYVHDNWLEITEETAPDTYKKYIEDDRSAASASTPASPSE